MGGVTHNPSKSSFLRRLARCAAALCLITLLAFTNTSCTDLDKLEDPELNDAIMAKIEMFGTDFSTSSSIPIDIQMGYHGVVRIYAGNPYNNSKAEELITLFTDKNGNYQGKMTIANRLLGTTLYAVGDNYSAVATASAAGTTFYSSARSELSRSSSSPLFNSDNDAYTAWCQNMYNYFIGWLPEGDPDKNKNNLDKLIKRENNDLQITKACKVRAAFLYSGAANYERLYYYYYTTGTQVDADYVKKFIDEDTKFNVFYSNDFGIPSDVNYSTLENTFDSNENPALPIVNNMKGGAAHGIINHESKPLYELYDFKYYGDPNNFSTTGEETIPAGTSIGFVLQTVRAYNGLDGKYSPLVYSDNRLNIYSANKDNEDDSWGYQVSRFTSPEGDNSVIIGFEDISKTMTINYTDNDYSSEWVGFTYFTESSDHNAYLTVDWDFNDLIVAFGAEPDGIETSDDKPLPVEEEEEGTPIYGTLLFEDLYPDQGDYDMNDVVVKYKITPTILSVYNEAGTDYVNYIKKITWEFYPYCDGASYTNDLHCGIQLPSSTGKSYMDFLIYKDNIHVLGNAFTQFTTGTVISDSDPTVLYFTSDGTANGTPYLKQTDFYGHEKEIFDPYIYVQSTQYEVHLTGKTATANTISIGKIGDPTDETGISSALNKYYALKTGTNNEPLEYPFAMDIPINDRAMDPNNLGEFRPANERAAISSECTDYLNWVREASDPTNKADASFVNPYEKWYTNHTTYPGGAIYYRYRNE